MHSMFIAKYILMKTTATGAITKYFDHLLYFEKSAFGRLAR